ncbi:unnamed protein product, partial [Mesorhabditis belari]|uniref:TIL domain-containing protein n=1 Tax=Mesorhabditis belari TaxID=2138241 RepID=A0AAF3ELE3_9BILA
MKIIGKWLSIGIFVIAVQVSNCDHLSENFDAAEEALLTDPPSILTPSIPTPSIPTPSIPTSSILTPSILTPSIPTPSIPTPSRTSRALENDPFPIPTSLEDFEKLQKLEISSDFPTPKPLMISGEITEVPFTKKTEKMVNFPAVTHSPIQNFRTKSLFSKQPSFPSSSLTTTTTRRTMTTRRIMTTTEQTCPEHEKWYRCQPCDLCTQFFDTICEKKCTPGCGCQRFYRRKNGQCIRVQECGFMKRSDLMTKKIEMTTAMTTIGEGNRMKSLPLLMKKLVENQKNFVRMSNMERGKEMQHTTPMPRTKIFEIQHPNLTTQKSPITTKITIPLKTETQKNRLTGNSRVLKGFSRFGDLQQPRKSTKR